VTPEDLAALVRATLAESAAEGELSVEVPEEVVIERPRVKEHGDYATPVALSLAKAAGLPPRQIAETLAARLRSQPGITAVDVAGPGFLNLTVAADALPRH
jgi:arginyl-tRNA synthetase